MKTNKTQNFEILTAFILIISKNSNTNFWDLNVNGMHDVDKKDFGLKSGHNHHVLLCLTFAPPLSTAETENFYVLPSAFVINARGREGPPPKKIVPPPLLLFSNQ